MNFLLFLAFSLTAGNNHLLRITKPRFVTDFYYSSAYFCHLEQHLFTFCFAISAGHKLAALLIFTLIFKIFLSPLSFLLMFRSTQKSFCHILMSLLAFFDVAVLVNDHSRVNGATDFSSLLYIPEEPTLSSVFRNWLYFKYRVAETFPERLQNYPSKLGLRLAVSHIDQGHPIRLYER